MKFNDVNIEQRVLEKTNELIFKKGIKGWNMDQLSDEVGLAKNTLYKIIGSKEVLIEKVIIEYIRGVQKQMVDVINNEKDYLTALQKMITLFPNLLNNFYTDSMQEIFIEYPSVEKSVHNHKDEITTIIINFIDKGIEKGILRNDISKELMFEIFQALILHFIKKGVKGEEISKKLAISFNCLIDGVRKK